METAVPVWAAAPAGRWQGAGGFAAIWKPESSDGSDPGSFPSEGTRREAEEPGGQTRTQRTERDNRWRQWRVTAAVQRGQCGVDGKFHCQPARLRPRSERAWRPDKERARTRDSCRCRVTTFRDIPARLSQDPTHAQLRLRLAEAWGGVGSPGPQRETQTSITLDFSCCRVHGRRGMPPPHPHPALLAPALVHSQTQEDSCLPSRWEEVDPREKEEPS